MLTPILDAGLSSRVQAQVLPMQTIAIGGSSGVAPVGVAGVMAPHPYPLAMANGLADSPALATGTAAASVSGGIASAAASPRGESLREGPLNPNFKVEEQGPERYSMGRGSIDVAPGQEVCLNTAGCGGGVNADQLSGLEIEGPAVDVGASQLLEKPAFSASGVAQRLLSWLGRSR